MTLWLSQSGIFLGLLSCILVCAKDCMNSRQIVYEQSLGEVLGLGCLRDIPGHTCCNRDKWGLLWT